MHPKYQGVKYYSASDYSICAHLKKAEPIMDAFDPGKTYTDVNEVLELYNIQQLMDIAYLREWDEQTKLRYKTICKQFSQTIGRYFAGINNNNFTDVYDAVCMLYKDDFWAVFVNYKTYLRISGEVFFNFLNRPETTLGHMLCRKDLVKRFDHEFAETMRHSDQTARLIVSKYLEKHDKPMHYYFPNELKSEEYDGILRKYVESDNVSFHVLQLLENAQSTKECPISDRLRQSARHAAKAYWKKRSVNAAQIEYGLRVGFCDQLEWKKEYQEGNTWYVSYDTKWLSGNLDYPTILDNFAYTFEQFDFCGRSTLCAKQSRISAVESIFQTRGIKDYPVGTAFNCEEALTTMQTNGYYNLLRAYNVQLEDVFKWFFEEYLPDEFGANVFRFNPPTVESTPVEKCRSLASEMDGVLKQFQMFVEDGSIDWERFAMSSSQIDFSQIPSLVPHKYAYVVKDECKEIQHILFSGQSVLAYAENEPDRYDSFYDNLLNKKMCLTDFALYQEKPIYFLIEHGYVLRDETDNLQINKIKCAILKDAYENEVLCPQWVPTWMDEIDRMCSSGDLCYGSTLFSIPEAKYLNYMLNRSEFSNGLDLRNKYIHSTYLSDDNIVMMDYMRLLKIMVLVIGKINEEFCLRDMQCGASG